MSALQILLDQTADRLAEADVFANGYENPDIEKIDKIVQTVPAMVTVNSSRVKPFFVYLNDQTRDFYGFEKNDVSFMTYFFFVKTFHTRTLHLLAHIGHFFYRRHTKTLKLVYRLRNAEGKYEKVHGVSKGIMWNEKDQLTNVLSITCRETDLALLNAVVTLGLEDLGQRQKETLGLLLKGLTNNQIGEEMGISSRTVEKHILVIYKEAGVSSRAEILQKTS